MEKFPYLIKFHLIDWIGSIQAQHMWSEVLLSLRAFHGNSIYSQGKLLGVASLKKRIFNFIPFTKSVLKFHACSSSKLTYHPQGRGKSEHLQMWYIFLQLIVYHSRNVFGNDFKILHSLLEFINSYVSPLLSKVILNNIFNKISLKILNA